MRGVHPSSHGYCKPIQRRAWKQNHCCFSLLSRQVVRKILGVDVYHPSYLSLLHEHDRYKVMSLNRLSGPSVLLSTLWDCLHVSLTFHIFLFELMTSQCAACVITLLACPLLPILFFFRFSTRMRIRSGSSRAKAGASPVVAIGAAE